MQIRLQHASKYIFSALVVCALVLGLATIVLFPPNRDQGGTDNWWPIVLNLSHGQGFTSCQQQYFPFCENTHQETASREPFPILLYALLARISNDSLTVIALFNLLIFVSVLIGIYALGKLVADEQVANLASLGWVLYLPGYRLIPQVAGDLLATLCFVWAMYFFFQGLRRQRLTDWAMVGLFLGLSAMSRSVLLFVGVALLGGFFFIQLRQRKLFIKQSLLAGLVMLVCLMPWAMRNLYVFGFPLVGTTLSGYNVYRHNGIIASDSWLHYASPKEGVELVNKLLATVPLRGDENEYEMNEIYTKEATHIIATYPQRYLMLSLYRFLPLWFDIGVNEAYSQSASIIDRIVILPQLFVLLTSVIGILLVWRSTWPLWLSILVVNLMHMAVNARIRFLVVVIPLLLIYSAITAKQIIHRLLLSRRSNRPTGTIDAPPI